MRKFKEGKFYILCIFVENYEILILILIKLKCFFFNSERIRFYCDNVRFICFWMLKLIILINVLKKCNYVVFKFYMVIKMIFIFYWRLCYINI